MDEQAFALLLEKLQDVKSDIKDLKIEIKEYKESNNKTLTKVRISLAKLVTIAACGGLVGGVVDNKFTPYFKNEKQKIERSIKNDNKGE